MRVSSAKLLANFNGLPRNENSTCDFAGKATVTVRGETKAVPREVQTDFLNLILTCQQLTFGYIEKDLKAEPQTEIYRQLEHRVSLASWNDIPGIVISTDRNYPPIEKLLELLDRTFGML